ncbi:hypothetical protein [Pasteurella canis]|uniref:hypothetical protein n=1 Tax=Pasteurella canis TaxID=753 RepID=UPI001CC15E6F|nr:hypothetical protein [Pasteurella canis]UAX42496.1 hypothetical protein K7G89_000314 [Pasteurella canis]
MKFIEKTIEDARTGAQANYHEITSLNTDYLNKKTYVSVASYVSREKKLERKDAISTNVFTIIAVPELNQVPYDWTLTELIKAAPPDFVPESYVGYVNPFLFAGGKIKQIETTQTA